RLQPAGIGEGMAATEGGTLPVVASQRADDAAQRAPVVKLARSPADVDHQRCLAPLIEVIAVTRGAAGQRGAQRRGAALEVRARAAHAVAVDHHAGVAIGDVLAAYRR